VEVIDLTKVKPLGQWRGPSRPVLTALAAPLAWLYGGAVWMWRRLPARPERMDVPVVSVGSILVGGTAKTPVTMLIAEELTRSGRRVCIVSRGYRRKIKRSPLVASDGKSLLATVEEAGDEPYLMARRLPGVGVVVGRDRAEAIRHASGALAPHVVLLDDGFQARSVVKDVEVVTLDAAALTGRQAMLPVGRLREAWGSLKDRDVVVLLLAAGEAKPEAALQQRLPGRRVFCVRRKRIEVFDGTGKLRDRETVSRAGCVLVSGVASPAGFEAGCREAGIEAKVSLRYDDHHWYSAEDAARIRDALAAHGCARVVTTEKDWAKLPESIRDRALVARADVALEDPESFWAELGFRLGECL
jgi:tetraacyldisaccharide 4'-kinase